MLFIYVMLIFGAFCVLIKLCLCGTNMQKQFYYRTIFLILDLHKRMTLVFLFELLQSHVIKALT